MKLELALVPPLFVKALAVPFMLGKRKYAEGDWATRPAEFGKQRMHSALRHIYDYMDGKVYDEDGQHNLAAGAWGCLLALYYGVKFNDEHIYERNLFLTRLRELEELKNVIHRNTGRPAVEVQQQSQS